LDYYISEINGNLKKFQRSYYQW